MWQKSKYTVRHDAAVLNFCYHWDLMLKLVQIILQIDLRSDDSTILLIFPIVFSRPILWNNSSLKDLKSSCFFYSSSTRSQITHFVLLMLIYFRIYPLYFLHSVLSDVWLALIWYSKFRHFRIPIDFNAISSLLQNYVIFWLHN